MAEVVWSRRAFDFLTRVAVDAPTTGQRIVQAIELLENHPLVGRKVERGLRELVISYGRAGFIALYRYRPARDVVLVLALRHQREDDYQRG